MTSDITRIVSDLKSHKMVLVRGIPGAGVNTFTKQLQSTYLKTYQDLHAELFPHEGTAIDKNFIEKIKRQNHIVPELSDSLVGIQKYLQITDKDILVTINKLDYFDNPVTILRFLDSLYRSFSKRLNVLISAHVFVLAQIPANSFERRFNDYMFTGFVDNFDEVVFDLQKQLDIEHIPDKIKALIFSYSYGHLGLILALLNLYKKGADLRDVNLVLASPDVRKRLVQITDSVNSAGYDLFQMVSQQNFAELTSLGLAYQKTINPLVLEYFKGNSSEHDIKDLLTATELQLYQILKNNRNGYLTIDDILSLLGDEALEKSSNWSIYKHLNNLGNKLQPFGVAIENRRGRGYKIS